MVAMGIKAKILFSIAVILAVARRFAAPIKAPAGDVLRDQNNMLAAIKQRDHLLQTVNQAADILLRSEPDDFSATMSQCLGMMARAIDADRMYLFKNYTENGKLHCTQLYEWSENVRPLQDTGLMSNISHDSETPWIREVLSRGECVHGLVRDMPPVDRAWLDAQGILSVLVIPIFIRNEFWGFVGFDNCRRERLFTENEESIMRSGSLLIANASLRNEYTLSLRQASAELERALVDTREANEAKSSFLAQMSHEIRTPLNAVIGLSELTLGDAALSPDAKSNLEKICGAGSTILSIVNDILDISKIESGKLEICPVQYDTPSFINDTVTLNVTRIGEKDIAFRLEVDEKLPGKLYGDDLRVKQIFSNLLSNAFKFTASGTVEWRVSFERGADGFWLVSSVRDTGIGIKPEDLPKLFLDYNQLDTKTNRQIEGTGLGLGIARRLAEMMGGGIEVESEYGRGTTFQVRLRQTPVSEAPIGREVAENLMDLRHTLSRRARAGLARLNLSYARVLIVDDIETNLDVAKGMLKPYGLHIDCAAGGRQAIEMIRAGHPRYSAVFMDHMMPGLDGLEATRIIRQEIGTDYARNVPIIAMTANAIVGNEEMFLSRGFQGFISKPVDTVKLDAALRRWVRDRSLEKELPERGACSPAGENGPAEGASSLLGGLTVNGVDRDKALERFGGSETVFHDVLRSYASNTRPLLSRLSNCLAAGDFDGYAVVVHGLKGASLGLGAREVGRSAGLLEAAARAGRTEEVRAGHSAFERAAEALLDDMDLALAALDADSRKPAAAGPAPELLREIREASEAYDMDRVDKAMARLESFRYERGGRLVAWLREQVDNMTFEAIFSGEWPAE